MRPDVLARRLLHLIPVLFGVTVIVESVIQSIWTADFRRLESAYGSAKFRLGALYVPAPELITLVLAFVLSLALWSALKFTDLGRAMRAAAEDGPIASAFGAAGQRCMAGSVVVATWPVAV